MKNKIVFVFIFTAVALAGIVAMIFLMQKGTESVSNVEPNIEPAAESQAKDEPKKIIPQPQLTLFDTTYFSLIFPNDWEQSSATDTLPIAIIDPKEQITNEKAKEIDFKTNLSINSAELGEVLFKNYVEDTKTMLIQTIPIMEITKEEDISISGKEAHYMEIKSVQDDLKFNTIVVSATGKDNTVWAFSFNTLEESWLDYKDIFSGAIKSIKMK